MAYTLAFAVLLLGACATAPSVYKRTLAGVDNFSEIRQIRTFAGSPVGFGGATDPRAMTALRDAGYVTVISLRAGTEKDVDHEASRKSAELAGLNYVELPYSPEESSPDTVDTILDRMADPGLEPVYLHCGSATRAAAIWMIGRITRDGLNREQASAEAEAIAGKPVEAVKHANRYLDAMTE